MLSRNRFVALIVVASLVCVVAGCGEGVGISGLAPVQGKVTLDGQPLSGAQVVFVPVDPAGRASVGATDGDGNYEIVTNTDKGAMPGSYRVAVSYLVRPDGSPITSVEEGMDATQLEASGQAKQGLPTRYSDPLQTELKFEVKPGKNEYNIDMKKG
jgi:hypothetical protein